MVGRHNPTIQRASQRRAREAISPYLTLRVLQTGDNNVLCSLTEYRKPTDLPSF